MAIESSRPSALALVIASPSGELSEADDLDEGDEPEAETKPKPKRHGSVKKNLIDWIDDHNIARHLDEDLLSTLGQDVVREYKIDEDSRGEWKEEAENALKFATQQADPKTYPWPNASNIIYPLISRAAIEFAATTYPSIVRNRNIVRGVVWGGDDGTPATQDGTPNSAPMLDANQQPVWLVKPGAKQLRADRIGEHMSWQLLERMDYWEWQTDTLFHQLPIVGGALRKTYRNFTADRNESVLVPLMNLVWNKHAKSFSEAPRHTEILRLRPYQILEYELDDETFLPIAYGPGDDTEDGEQADDKERAHIFLEQHRRYDLDGDGYPEPVIVTVNKQSANVVRIVARYDEMGIFEKGGEIRRIEAIEHYTLYPFLPDPRGGSYPIGFGHLLKPLNEAINTTLNQMFDAGHLQIAGGGFVGTSLSLHAGPVNFQIGEYKPVNNKGMNIRDSVFPIPFPGPNAVLFQMLGFLTTAAEQIAATQNIDVPSLSNMAPTTLLVLITQGQRTYTAIHKRIYRALKNEFDKIYRLNRVYLVDDEKFKVGDTWRTVTPEDYRLGGGVEPAADPTMITDMQRLGRAMVIKEFANDPLVNPLEARRRYFDACQIERIDKLLASQMPPPPPNAQLELAQMQAAIGRSRAAEQKDFTQAVLNMALARAKATAPEMEWIDKQIQVMQMHIEALNTTVHAADVDAKFHGHNVRMKIAQDQAREVANERPAPRPAPAPEPAGGGTLGSGIPAMAPPPGNANGSALPGGQGAGLPGMGALPMGGGPDQGQ